MNWKLLPLFPGKMTKIEGETDLSGLFGIFLKRRNIPHKSSGADPGFSKGGLMKRGPQRRLSSPGKCDFHHPEAKSACFDFLFFKVKVTFFLDKNITKLRKNDANTLHFNFFQLFLCFIKDRINKKHFSWVSFHKKLNQRIVVNRLYLVNVHHR